MRRELVGVHRELTRIVAERDSLAALWEERNAAAPRRGVRAWAGRVKRDLARLRRSLRQREIGLTQAAGQLVRIGSDRSAGKSSDWDDRYRVLREAMTTSQFRGDQPLRRAKNAATFHRGLLWKDLLEQDLGGDPGFQKAALFLATRTGAITEELRWASRLGVTDLGVRRTVASVNGRARELTGWVPRLPGPAAPVVPAQVAGEDRILHLVPASGPYHQDASTARHRRALRAQRDAGLQPVVVTELGFPRDLVGDDFPEAEEVDGILHHRLDPGIPYGEVPADRWLEDFAWYAHRRVQDLRPAVVHVTSGRRGFETALVALALKAKTGLPVVYEVTSLFETAWTGEGALEETSEVYRRRLEVERMCMVEADAVVVPGPALQDELVSRGVRADRVHLVPEVVDLREFAPRTRDAELAAEYRLTGLTVGCVATMDHRREGQEVLIKAMSLLKERGLQVRCVLVGEGARRDGLWELVKLYDVIDRVVLTGPADAADPARHHSLIDVFVVPRVHERAATYVAPAEALEAMAMARPVVAADLPALAGLLGDGERGRVFAPEDPVDLARVLGELLADEDGRERMGSAGRRWVEQAHSGQAAGQRYREVYRAVSTSQTSTEGA
ncbi:glycosyltransferase family 4 protein [Citricoccus sp. NPDC055426]|uniref:glycosyltransferase family 4 protein n=1 Tax=Citricoccus sp. NPDC055426 TaxID=3155536 RepID=UPI00342DB335